MMYSLFQGYHKLVQSESKSDESLGKTLLYAQNKELALIGVKLEQTFIVNRKNPDVFACGQVKSKMLSFFQIKYSNRCVQVGRRSGGPHTERFLIAVPKDMVGQIITEEQNLHTLLMESNRAYDRYLTTGFGATNSHASLLEYYLDTCINQLRYYMCTCAVIEGRVFPARAFSSLEISLIMREEETTMFMENPAAKVKDRIY
jgi:hypothetical protein